MSEGPHADGEDEILDVGSARRRRTWWVAVVCTLAVTAGTAAVVDAGHSPAPEALPVPLPAPRTVDVGRNTYWEHPADPTVARAGDNSTLLTVYMAREVGNTPECTHVHPRVEVVSQNDESVTVAGFDYSARTLPQGTYMCAYATTAGSGSYQAVDLRLDAPLAGRRLIAASSGSVIGLLGTDSLPVPGYLPSGFRPSLSQQLTAVSDFIALRQYTRGGSSIEVRLRSASAWRLDGAVRGHDSVDGHDATVTDESYERCVSWHDDEDFVREVCSLDAHHDFLSDDELLRIAHSLP